VVQSGLVALGQHGDNDLPTEMKMVMTVTLCRIRGSDGNFRNVVLPLSPEQGSLHTQLSGKECIQYEAFLTRLCEGDRDVNRASVLGCCRKLYLFCEITTKSV
jgi:hypothetical protein